MSDPTQPPQDPYGYPPAEGSPPYGYPPTVSYHSAATGPPTPASTIVLGIIGLLYAIYLTVCVCAGLVMIGAGGTFLDQMQGAGGLSAQDRAELEAELDVNAWDIVGGILSIGIGILAWIGSIGSFMGKEIGRKALLVFAAGFLLLMLLNIIVQAVMGFPDFKEAQAEMGGQGTSVPMGLFIGIGAICIALFLIYPLCVLWFYTREPVKQWFKGASSPAAGDPQGMYFGQ